MSSTSQPHYEQPVSRLIEHERALELVLDGAARLGTETVAIGEAEGRFLAENVVTAHPLPPFSYSAMDGYALSAASAAGAGPWTLPVSGESRAGAGLDQLQPGTACRIFTGAPIPSGANSVIMQEDARRDGDTLHFDAVPQSGQFVRQRGEDMAQGAIALHAGTRLGPAQIGLAASLDRAKVQVATAPVVTIISTGDELRAPGEAGPPGSVAESNSLVAALIARRLGAEVPSVLRIGDDRQQTQTAIDEALTHSDLLVTIGGASKGDHDHVRAAVTACGVEPAFWGVAIKPGKPTGFGQRDRSRILCLPGNPASATLTFLLFAVPLLRALQGAVEPRPRYERLLIQGTYAKRGKRREFLRAQLDTVDGEPVARLMKGQASGAVGSFAEADALVVVPAERDRVEDGERLPTLRLEPLWA